jgi:hypothetical protein
METTPTNFKELIGLFLGLIYELIPVVMGLCLLVFIWGLVKFISNANDSKTHAQGAAFMRWGIIGLFVMVSFMSIIRFFYNDIGFTNFRNPNTFLPEN